MSGVSPSWMTSSTLNGADAIPAASCGASRGSSASLGPGLLPQAPINVDDEPAKSKPATAGRAQWLAGAASASDGRDRSDGVVSVGTGCGCLGDHT